MYNCLMVVLFIVCLETFDVDAEWLQQNKRYSQIRFACPPSSCGIVHFHSAFSCKKVPYDVVVLLWAYFLCALLFYEDIQSDYSLFIIFSRSSSPSFWHWISSVRFLIWCTINSFSAFPPNSKVVKTPNRIVRHLRYTQNEYCPAMG
jgi:hypothetical protein